MKSKIGFFDKIAIKMFCPEFEHVIFEKRYSLFESVIGYDNIKIILSNLLKSEYPVSILLTGSAGCGKSLFLKEIELKFPAESYYIDGSRATKAGIFEVLFKDTKNNIKYLLIDELDKMSTRDQESLLTLIQDGKLVQTLKTSVRSKNYDFLSVIGASNQKESILYPLLSRFYVIHIKEYTHSEFMSIALHILTQKYGVDYVLAIYIIDKVWDDLKKANVRDCENIAKLANNSREMVDLLIENTLKS
jgi:Cdc6-like AAA superfamily ATPase